MKPCFMPYAPKDNTHLLVGAGISVSFAPAGKTRHGLFGSNGERIKCDTEKFIGMKFDEGDRAAKTCPGTYRPSPKRKRKEWKPKEDSDGARIRREGAMFPGMGVCHKHYPCTEIEAKSGRTDGCFGRCCRGFPPNVHPKGGLWGGNFIKTGLEWFRYM